MIFPLGTYLIKLKVDFCYVFEKPTLKADLCYLFDKYVQSAALCQERVNS